MARESRGAIKLKGIQQVLIIDHDEAEPSRAKRGSGLAGRND